MGSKFEDNFWGEGTHGYEVLLQNMKSGLVASKELGDYIKERMSVEDSYCKGLSKLHKSVQHVSGATLGGFGPLWEIVTEMSGRLSDIHVQLVKMLGELNKEVADYHNAQKDKLKANMKGEIEMAQEALLALQGTDTSLQRTKKQYQQSVEHVAKAAAKRKGVGDPLKAKQLDFRVDQAKAWMATMEDDHKASAQRNCDQVLDFLAKMKEAYCKFESLEEEHLAQMTNFMLKITKTQDTHHIRTEQVYTKVNEQLNTMSVEFLLAEIVRTKGTGKNKPVPYKFKRLDIPQTVSISASSEDLRSSSPNTSRTQSKGEKGLKGLLKRKKKKEGGGNGGQQPTLPESNVEVDEEGYSIRPQDAANIGSFPGQEANKSDWDSDSSDDEPESRIKKIKIRETSEKPVATLDDIKASVKGLKLGSGSPGIRKATSSQSLNMFSSPHSTRRGISPSNSSHNTSEQASVASLMDIDLILSGGSQLQGIPSPLEPQASLPPPLLGADPTETLTPWSLGDALKETESSEPFASLPSSIPPLLPDPLLSSTTSPIPHAASEPVIPRLVVPDKKPSPPPPQENGLAPRPENATKSTVPTTDRPDPLPSVEEKPQEPKRSNGDKEKTHLPLIQPPPRRVNSTAPNRKNSSSSELRVVSPLTVSTRSVSESPTNVRASPKSSVSSSPLIPLAVAFRETCDATFHGKDETKCVYKVSGEVVVSFPSNYLAGLASCEALTFQLTNSSSVERVLHNQQLLKKTDSEQLQYIFDMSALLAQLKQMKEKHASPFYNVQLLKYEVKLADSTHLPLKLISYWKCEDSITNFRMDYTYLSSSLKTSSGENKPLTNVSVSVPVSGGVRNALSKPTGSWNAEQNKMVWELKTLSPSQEQATSLHAKFNLTDGPSIPSSAVVNFECEGATLSGLNFELCGNAYKISLLKFKCSSGKYTADAS